MKINRDKLHELYSWGETRRVIARGELPGDFLCIPLAPLEGYFRVWLSVANPEEQRKFWFGYLESEATHTPELLSVSVSSGVIFLSLFVPRSHDSICCGGLYASRH